MYGFRSCLSIPIDVCGGLNPTHTDRDQAIGSVCFVGGKASGLTHGEHASRFAANSTLLSLEPLVSVGVLDLGRDAIVHDATCQYFPESIRQIMERFVVGQVTNFGELGATKPLPVESLRYLFRNLARLCGGLEKLSIC